MNLWEFASLSILFSTIRVQGPGKAFKTTAYRALITAVVGWLMLGAAVASVTERVTFRLEMPEATRHDWVRCLETYEPGYVRLNPGTLPGCAEAAMGLTRDAIRESELGPGDLDAIEVTVDVPPGVLSMLGFGRPDDARGLALAYLTAANPDEYIVNLRDRAAGEVSAGTARALPAGFTADGELTAAAAEAATGLYFRLAREFSAAELDRGFHHPDCGDLELRFKLIAGRQLGSRREPFLRFATRAVCLAAAPGAGVPHAFGVVADFPALAETGGDAADVVVLRLATPGHSMVTAACEPAAAK